MMSSLKYLSNCIRISLPFLTLSLFPAGDGWAGERHVPILQDSHAEGFHGRQETHGQVCADRGDYADRYVGLQTQGEL